MKLQQANICAETIDSILDKDLDKALSADVLAHLESCKDCRDMMKSVGKLQASGSPFNKEHYALDTRELKSKILKQLEPSLLLLANKNKSSKPNSLIAIFGFWRSLVAVATFAAIVALCLYMIGTPTCNTLRQELPVQRLASSPIESNYYQISSNGVEQLISIDNPISLFETESVKINLPDGSIASLKGPARMSVSNRGFHLTSGELFIKVKKDSTPFIGTTPHCTITVLGTSFTCQTNSKKTLVSVQSGKVAVSPNMGNTKILQAHETTEVEDTSHENKTDSVSPKDSE